MDLRAETIASGGFKEYLVPLIGFYLSVACFEPLVFSFISTVTSISPQGFFQIFNVAYLVLPLLVFIISWYFYALEIPIYPEFLVGTSNWEKIQSEKGSKFRGLIAIFKRFKVRTLIWLFISFFVMANYCLFYDAISIPVILCITSSSFSGFAMNYMFHAYRSKNQYYVTDKTSKRQSSLLLYLVLTMVGMGILFFVFSPKEKCAVSKISYSSAFSSKWEYDSIRMIYNKNLTEIDQLKYNLESKLITIPLKFDFPNKDTLVISYRDNNFSAFIQSAQTSIQKIHHPLQADHIMYRLDLVENMEFNKVTAQIATTKSEFKSLFEQIKIRSMAGLAIIVLFLLLILMVVSFHKKANQTEGKLVKITLGVYLALLIKMANPIDVSHLNLDEPGFMYRYSNWYLPQFVSDKLERKEGFSYPKRTSFREETDLSEVLKAIDNHHLVNSSNQQNMLEILKIDSQNIVNINKNTIIKVP